jgi:hypothetical protein
MVLFALAGDSWGREMGIKGKGAAAEIRDG